MSTLSVIITVLNDDDLGATIASIRDTAGDAPEIVIVDDSSIMPVQSQVKNCKVIRNVLRCGVGPSRHIGALAASGEYLLFVDAHMRFTNDWYPNAMRRLEARPKTVHCGQCVGLRKPDKMNPNDPAGIYWGATINVFGPDRQKPGSNQVLEAVWGPQVPDDAEIPCIMGACYFCPRDWFLKLGALRYLRGWGSDELFLSTKSWLAGGDVRFMQTVKIGHVFTDASRKRFVVPVGYPAYNKLLFIRTIVEPGHQSGFIKALKGTMQIREFTAAEKMIRDDWHIVSQETQYNRQLFHRPFSWLCEKFGLNLPTHWP